MAAVRRRVCQLSSIPGFGASKSKVSSSSTFQRAILDSFPVFGARHCSHLVKSNCKHLFFVDTLALVRRLEEEGVPSKQAEVIIATTTEVLNDSLENMSQSLVSKEKMQKIEMMQESNLSKFKVEMENSQGHYFSRLHHETEKLRNDVEKMHIELRHDIDKVIDKVGHDIDKVIDKVGHDIDKVGREQRSDFNLEMGKIREELSKQKAETNILTNKLDGLASKLDGVSDNMTSKLNGEMDSIRAHVEAVKYDIMKYFMGTILSIATVGLAVLRLSNSK